MEKEGKNLFNRKHFLIVILMIILISFIYFGFSKENSLTGHFVNLGSENGNPILNYVISDTNSGMLEGPILGDTSVNNCTTLSIANTIYTLTSNVSSNSTCFTVSANNVTLNGGGYTINYSANGSTLGYGVYVNANFTTVNNLNIVEGTANVTTENGIFLNYVNNCTIFNNSVVTLNSTSQGILIYHSLNNTLISNTGTVTNGGANRGIYLSGSNYTILINNTGTSIFGYGIYLLYSSNDTLINNTGISNASAGIQVDTSPNNTLFDNTGTSNTGRGIYIVTSSNCNLIGNTGISNNNSGIYVSGSLNETLINNTGISNSSNAIYFYAGVNNSLLINNTGISNASRGILISISSNNTLINNTGLTVSGSNGIEINTCLNNSLIGNVGNSTSGRGIYIVISNFTTLINNTGITNSSTGYSIQLNLNSRNNILINNTGISNSGNAMLIDAGCNYNNLTGNTALSNSGYALRMISNSNNSINNQIAITNNSYGIYLANSNYTTIQDCNASGITGDIYLTSNSINNTFINCSYNTSKETVDAGSQLYRIWYYRAYVKDANKNNVSNVNVTAFNSANDYNFNLTTDATGYTPIGQIIEYFNNGETRSYYSNYNIIATNTTSSDSHSYNVTTYLNNMQDNFTFNLDSCMTLSAANTVYTLTSNVTSNSTCFTITANNITLDGAGYTINYSANGSTVGYGVYVIGYNFSIIKNLNVVEGTGNVSTSYGIYLNTASNGTIINNNVTTLGTNSRGIYLQTSCSNNSIINNNVYVNNSYAIYILTKSNNNTLINNTGSSILNGSGRGIDISGSNSNILINNLGTSNSSYGIYLESSSNFTTLTNNIGISNYSYGIYVIASLNTILTNNTGTSNTGRGIYVIASLNTILTNNTGTSNTSAQGIAIVQGSNNTFLNNNLGISNASSGIAVTNSFNNTLINNTGITITGTNGGIYIAALTNNTLINNTGISNSTYGIYLYSTNYSLLSNNTGISNYSYGIYLYASYNVNMINTIAEGLLSGSQGIHLAYLGNTIVQDCINVSGVSLDVHATSTSLNNTFINCSYNTSKETVDAGSQLYRIWYYRAHVNDTNGNNINNANVTAFNVSNDYALNLTTDATGYTPIGQIIEYWNNGGTRSYYSNYNITATNTTSQISHLYNVTDYLNNLADNFTFDFIPPVISIDYPQNNTYSSNAGLNVNYTTSDLGIGVQNCWYSNDSYTINVSLGACDNLTTATWSEGQHNVTVWANDSAGNVNSSTISFTIDTTPPTVSLVSPDNSYSWTSSSTVTFTYNVTDVNSIVNCSLIIDNALDQTATSVTKNTGQTFDKSMSNADYNWGVNCTDVAGNQGNSSTYALTVSYILPAAPSGGGGGGGGSSSVSNQTQQQTNQENVSIIKLISSIASGDTSTIGINNASFGLKEIQIKVNNEAQNIKLSIVRFFDKPATVPEGENAYQYLQITAENVSDKLDNALVTIQVEKSWLSSNNIDNSKISLFQLDEMSGDWNEINTSYISEDDNYYYYQAELKHFSYFYIGESISSAGIYTQGLSIISNLWNKFTGIVKQAAEGIKGVFNSLIESIKTYWKSTDSYQTYIIAGIGGVGTVIVIIFVIVIIKNIKKKGTKKPLKSELDKIRENLKLDREREKREEQERKKALEEMRKRRMR